jgi:NADH-quinone oxidoreductase subunit M
VRYPVYGVVATLGIILAAIYVLHWYQRVAHGPAAEGVKSFRDLGGREIAAVAPLVVLVIVLGFFPKPVLDVINPAVARTLQTVDQHDPAPTVPAAAAQEGTAP